MNEFLKQKNKNASTLLLHLLVWIVLFSIPYLFSYDNPDVISKMMQRTWFTLFLIGVVFYINYFFLIEKFFFQKKNFLYVGINIIIALLFSFLLFEMRGLFHMPKPPMEMYDFGRKGNLIPPPNGMFIYLSSLSFTVPVIFSLILKITDKWRRNETINKEQEKNKLESELKYLKHQLQPHFFFNTINNIYSLIDVSANDAKKSLHKLGKLMRYLLYNTADKYSLLEDELKFLKNYIELMKLRVSDNVVVSVDFPLVDETMKIPPLLFISLVENSFKHGVDAIKPSSISIVLTIEDNKIHFQCINSLFENFSEDISDKGIGINNLERKLELLYGNEYALVNEIKEGKYFSELVIPVAYE